MSFLAKVVGGDKSKEEEKHETERRGSTVGEEDEVPELREGRFARRMKKGNMWTSEESYENDKEVLRSNDPKEKALWAAEKNELQLLQDLIAGDPQLVNATDTDLYTPLHRACYSDHVEVIKFLLDNKANIEAKTADGWTPLHCAARWDNVESAAVLIAAGADINAMTNGKQQPVHLAASYATNREARDTLELLLWQKSLDVSHKNAAGDLPEILAARSGIYGSLFEMTEASANHLRYVG